MNADYYRVWRPEKGQDEKDGIDVWASSSKRAAEDWADNYDFSTLEFEIVGGDSAVVCVRDPEGISTTWEVSGRSERIYTAKER